MSEQPKVEKAWTREEMLASVERSIAMVRDLRARFKREELDKQRKGEALVRGAAELRTKG
jgi:hypothetical protein